MPSRPNLRCRVIIGTALDHQFVVRTEMTMIDVDLLVAIAPAAMVTVTEALPVEATMMTVVDMIALLHGPVDQLTTTRHLLVLVVMRMLIAGTILHHQIPT